MAETITRGWGVPAGSRKAHYFVESESLCRRWFWTRGHFRRLKVASDGHNNCAECKRRLGKSEVATS